MAESQLPRSVPEAFGLSSSAILDLLDAVDETSHDLHSFMFLRRGHVLAEGWWAPYSPEVPHELYSMCKSFTATAIGLAVAEGRLTVEDAVIDLLPDDAPATASEELASLQVRHLLMTSTGHDPHSEGRMYGHPEGNCVMA